jgi:hypothetical protein
MIPDMITISPRNAESVQSAKMMNRHRIILGGVYVILIGLMALFSFRRPEYNWDMLPYMAVILRMEDPDPKRVHQLTYETARKELPEQAYALLIGSEKRKMYSKEPAVFYDQLPFYVVKPLYTGLVYLFHKSGVALSLATVLPSILSYLLMGLLVLKWLNQSFHPLFAFAVSLCIMNSNLVIEISRLSTPDGLSALLVMFAIYCVAQRKHFVWIALFFMLALFARLDNIISAVFLSSFLYFGKRWNPGFQLRQYIILLALFLVSYLIVSSFASSFGWDLTYYPQFAQYIGATREYGHLPLPQRYLALVKSELITGFYYTHFVFFLFLFTLQSYPELTNWRKWSTEQALCIVFLGVIATRFILFPDLSDRFFLPYYISIMILFAKRYGTKFTLSDR